MSSTPTPSGPKLSPAPPKGRYRLLALLDAPRRLVHPGCLADGVDTKSPVSREKYGGATAGNVRGLERTRLADITLDDVIAGRHLPPLTLKDFEDYLCWKKKAAENLYFELWLRSYEKLYNTCSASSRTTSQRLQLQQSYRLALDAFFNAESPLELNTSADDRREIDAAVLACNDEKAEEPFLKPAAFERVRSDTNKMLNDSFRSFVANQARNADRNRAWFAQFLGITTYLLGLVPTIVCTQVGASRGWRALGLFFWWFGMVVAIGGLKRTCLVIYLFGDSRQLYPWELATQGRSLSDSTSFISDWSNYSPGTPGSPNDIEKGSPSPRRRESSIVSYFPLSPTLSQSSSSADVSSTAPSEAKLYFAPSLVLPTLPASSPVWAPFTRVMSPVVCRAQRDTVVNAAGVALLVMIVTAVICLAVPNRR